MKQPSGGILTKGRGPLWNELFNTEIHRSIHLFIHLSINIFHTFTAGLRCPPTEQDFQISICPVRTVPQEQQDKMTRELDPLTKFSRASILHPICFNMFLLAPSIGFHPEVMTMSEGEVRKSFHLSFHFATDTFDVSCASHQVSRSKS